MFCELLAFVNTAQHAQLAGLPMYRRTSGVCGTVLQYGVITVNNFYIRYNLSGKICHIIPVTGYT